jgi:hypothetical protein
MALLCASALFCGGCSTKKRPALSMSSVVLAHPIAPKPVEMAMDDAPDLPLEIEPVPRLVIPHGAPARPRVAPAREPEPVPAEKPAEPLIAPELSDEQLSAAKSETEKSLDIAERNLGMAQGKTLNAAQQDLVSKIRGFMDSARMAMRDNDWPRARSQAKKAEVLSQEFSPNP